MGKGRGVLLLPQKCARPTSRSPDASSTSVQFTIWWADHSIWSWDKHFTQHRQRPRSSTRVLTDGMQTQAVGTRKDPVGGDQRRKYCRRKAMDSACGTVGMHHAVVRRAPIPESTGLLTRAVFFRVLRVFCASSAAWTSRRTLPGSSLPGSSCHHIFLKKVLIDCFCFHCVDRRRRRGSAFYKNESPVLERLFKKRTHLQVR